MSNYTYFYENKKSEEAEENVKRMILEKFRNGLNSHPVMEAIPGSQKHNENILDELETLLDKYASLCKVPLNIQNESKNTKQNPDCRNISTRNSSKVEVILHNKNVSKHSPYLTESLTIMNDNTCFYENKKSEKAPDYMKIYDNHHLLWTVPLTYGLGLVVLAIIMWKDGSSIGE